MATFNGRHVLVERAREGVWVVRFVRADLRDQLYDDADADACPLFQQLFERALAHLQEGQTVILNFGLVEQFPAAFYRCLLKVREVVAARHIIDQSSLSRRSHLSRPFACVTVVSAALSPTAGSRRVKMYARWW